MQGVVIPDIRPLIANDQWAVRMYWCVALILLTFGVSLFAVSILVFFQSGADYRSLEKIGSSIGGLLGLVFSSLSALPLEKIVTLQNRLRVLRVVDGRLAELKARSEIPDEYVQRVVEMVWDKYNKVITA